MIYQNRKKALALAISSALISMVAHAQEQQAGPAASPDETVEEVVVKGVRASQAKAVDIKRNNVNIVDSIVAEDIGKLPDTTITDSLQRVTGVQIKREANEGTSLNIRGMPQVLTTLNGEQFLSPWNITDVGANYSDVPATLIRGVDVYKSQSASAIAGGISGVVDLKTIKPLSMKDGWTGSLKLEASQGSLSKTEMKKDGSEGTRRPDDNTSFFVGYKDDEHQIGINASGFKSTTYNANYSTYVNSQFAFLDRQNGTPTDPLDLDGDGDKVNDWYLAPESYGVSSSFMTREREGGSFSIEAGITDELTVRGDVFYTRMDQYDRGVEASFGGKNNAFSYDVNNQPIAPAGTYGDYAQPIGVNGQLMTDENLYNTLISGSEFSGGSDFSYVDENGVRQTRQIHALRVAKLLSPEFLSYSRNKINRTGALNSNIQVDFDNQDNLKASLRFIYAKAEKQYREAALQQGSPAWLWVDVDGVNGKDPINPFPLTVDYTGEYPKFSYEGDVSDASKLANYQAGAKGSNTEATLGVIRADVNYAFDSDVVQSVDLGIRHGVRDAQYNEFYYVTPTGRYDDDQRIPLSKRNQLFTGNELWQRYPDFRYFDYNRELLALRNAGLLDNGFRADDPSITTFKDFGPFKGFENGVAALNPAAWDNPLDFLNRLYSDGTTKVRTVDDPAYAYEVEESSTSTYFQLNLDDSNGLWGIPYKGNVGVQVLSTDREVTRHKIPEVLDIYNSIGYKDYQKLAFVYEKDRSNRSFVQTLPSLNLNFFPVDDVIVRVAAAKTTSRNDLKNVGSGLNLWYTQCNKTDENGNRVMVLNGAGQLVGDNVTCVGGGSDQGNIDIKPWSANVYNMAAEWYFAENAILGLGLFQIDIATSVQNFQERRSFVDADGIDRGNTGLVWVSQNVGASSLHGLELGYKQPFSFLPGAFLSSTGIEANYTYSVSESTDRDIEGNVLPLPSNSKHQSNLILWYDKAGVNVRLAYNWKSAEYDGIRGLNFSGAPAKMATWIEPVGYLDLSISYWVNEHLSFNLNGTNLTEQSRKAYSQYKDQLQSIWVQERRLSAGVTFTL
jgi:iron complex outermembrane recepter protein